MKEINAYYYPTPAQLEEEARRVQYEEDTAAKAIWETLQNADYRRELDQIVERYLAEWEALLPPPEDDPNEGAGCPLYDEEEEPSGPDPDDFIWVSHRDSAKSYLVSEMATAHIFYALRMIYNHSVPPAFRVGDFQRYPDVGRWSAAYRKGALTAFTTELQRRMHKPVKEGGLEQDLKYEFEDMQANTKVILALGL